MRDTRSLPKPKRIAARDTLQRVVYRRDGACMVGMDLDYGPCSEGRDAHHITHRGAGGDDVEENLITLCRRHHDMVHLGQISREELYEILKNRYGYQYG
jgi:5-methylcytosine-specific restriction endonuclease McrA